MNKDSYFGIVKNRISIVNVKFSVLVRGLVLFFLLCALFECEVKSQVNYIVKKDVTPLGYDDFPVNVIVEGFGNFYLNIIYTNNNVVYINIEELFKTLNITCLPGENGNSLSGFIEKETHRYKIDYINGQIKVGDVIMDSQNGLIKEMGTLYLESSILAQAFGITLNFSFQDLTMFLKSSFELPIIKKQRLEKMRSNLSKLRGEEIVDTVVQRNYHAFKFGTLDWSVGSSQVWNKLAETTSQKWKGTSDNHVGLGVGTELFFGEADISFDYYSQSLLSGYNSNKFN